MITNTANATKHVDRILLFAYEEIKDFKPSFLHHC